VKESEHEADLSVAPSQPATTASSPSLIPATTGPSESPDDSSEMNVDLTSTRRSSSAFSQQTRPGSDFWNTFDERTRTPPPPLFPRYSSSMSEDLGMDTPASSLPSAVPVFAQSRSSTPQPSMAAELSRKTLGKRRRDDDFDQDLFKRRAVSPGLSVQGSPILPPSPMHRDGGWWQAKANRENSLGNDKAGNGSSSGISVVGKRVGMQGMNDTNDGISSMSID